MSKQYQQHQTSKGAIDPNSKTLKATRKRDQDEFDDDEDNFFDLDDDQMGWVSSN